MRRMITAASNMVGFHSSSSGLKIVQLKKSRMMQTRFGSSCMGAS